MSTFGLSFVGRFVLFRSVLYRRFHCRLHFEFGLQSDSLVKRNFRTRPFWTRKIIMGPNFFALLNFYFL